MNSPQVLEQLYTIKCDKGYLHSDYCSFTQDIRLAGRFTAREVYNLRLVIPELHPMTCDVLEAPEDD